MFARIVPLRGLEGPGESPGKHTIRVSSSGYKDWSRDITVISGSGVNLTAALEKSGT